MGDGVEGQVAGVGEVEVEVLGVAQGGFAVVVVGEVQVLGRRLCICRGGSCQRAWKGL